MLQFIWKNFRDDRGDERGDQPDGAGAAGGAGGSAAALQEQMEHVRSSAVSAERAGVAWRGILFMAYALDL